MKYKRGSNPLGEGEFWVELDDDGKVLRALWIRSGNAGHQRLTGDLFEAVTGVCNVVSMTTEEDRFEKAWERADKPTTFKIRKGLQGWDT